MRGTRNASATDFLGRYGVGAHRHGLGVAHGPRAGLLLRRFGAQQKRAEHDVDEPRGVGAGDGAVGVVRVQSGVWPGFALDWRLCPPWLQRGDVGTQSDLRAGAPPCALCGVPGDVRRHFGGPLLRRDYRSHAVCRLSHLWTAVDHAGVRPTGALGVGRWRVAAHPRGARLRRWHGGAYQCRCDGTRAGQGVGPAPRLQAHSHGAAQRAVRALGRGAAVVWLVWLQRRVGACGRRHCGQCTPHHPRRGRGRLAHLVTA